jgi:uncharacterized protein
MKFFKGNHTGIGLKTQHVSAVLDAAIIGNAPGWVEVHPQNYFTSAHSRNQLIEVAKHYPLSFHSTGLSLGSADGLNRDDLEQLVTLCDDICPALISDHISFSGNAHDRLADLLPIPYTYEALDHVVRQIHIVQDRLGRQLLLENPARYLSYRHNDMDEVEFIRQLVVRTGCGLLLDINNVHVTTYNVGDDAQRWLDRIDPDWVGEIHLAGHSVDDSEAGRFLVDDHGSAVRDAVWDSFARFIATAGPKPTLVEWDNDIPEFDVLLAEASKAKAMIEANHAFA